MMALVGISIFAGAFALSAFVIAAMVGPQWRRIVRLAMGRIEPGFAPLQTLADAERRIAVRRWASAPLPAHAYRFREAA